MPLPLVRWRRRCRRGNGRDPHARRATRGVDDLPELRGPGGEAGEAGGHGFLGQPQGGAEPTPRRSGRWRPPGARSSRSSHGPCPGRGAAAARDDGSQAGLAARDHHAHAAGALALHAHRLAGQLRPAADGRGRRSSTSWRVSMGQPRSSASTSTWSATGVAVASVSTYSGVSIHGRDEAGDAAIVAGPRRRAWMPPLVAQAPMVTSRPWTIAQVADVAQLLHRC